MRLKVGDLVKSSFTDSIPARVKNIPTNGFIELESDPGHGKSTEWYYSVYFKKINHHTTKLGKILYK